MNIPSFAGLRRETYREGNTSLTDLRVDTISFGIYVLVSPLSVMQFWNRFRVRHFLFSTLLPHVHAPAGTS